MSPQLCDDLTENGRFLKVNQWRRKKSEQPIQEVRELFPERVQKSAAKRNPLVFKQSTETDERPVCELHTDWCSQEISLYPSTCMPRSRRRLGENVSSANYSINDEGEAKCDGSFDEYDCHKNKEGVSNCLDNQFDYRGYVNDHLDGRVFQEFPSLSMQQTSLPQSVDDHTVPSAPQSQGNEFDGIKLRLRLSIMTQHVDHSDCEQEPTELGGQDKRHSSQHTPSVGQSCSVTFPKTWPHNDVVHQLGKKSFLGESSPGAMYIDPHAGEKGTGGQSSYAMCSISVNL